MQVDDFKFFLPDNLIAQSPISRRDASRLMLLDKKNGKIEHKTFRDITNLINPGDCIVLNDTKVIPARLLGEKKDTAAKIELLLLKQKGKNIWETLAKPGKKVKTGDTIIFGGGILTAHIEAVTEDGNRLVRFEHDGIFEEVLDMLGEMPLPPYIKNKLKDKNRYQTVYAKNDGSAAAPTAGLHFTNELLNELSAKKINIAYITLHVGLGTFRPVKADNILDHKMHSEYYNIENKQADIINKTKLKGGKIIAVGTTACRTLEACSGVNGEIKESNGLTDIFIYPGYKFKVVDGLITNFHLPESTLIMLVSALAGRENILNAYDEAVKHEYRFFSFGDAMAIL